MNRLSTRLRLTFAFAFAIALLLFGGSLLLLAQLERSLDRGLDQALRARAADIAALVKQADTGLRQAPPVPFAGGAAFAQVLTRNGQVFDETRGLRAAPLISPQTLRRAERGSVFVSRTRVLGSDVRLIAVPVRAQGRSLVIVAGSSLATRDEAVAGLRRELVMGCPVALLVVSVVGYLLAAAALRPVERMRRRASSISDRALHERLPVPPAPDEIGRLGVTLNEMLGRIQSGVEHERAFVADASHELRTPLSLVRAEVDLALESVATREQLRSALVSIGEETDRLTQLAEDLLLLARVDQGKLLLHAEELDVRTLLDGIAVRYGRRSAALGRRIHVEGGEAIVVADRFRLEQAIANLVENALRHGRGDVVLKADAGADSVEVAVTDEGPGIPHALAPRVFDRFARDDDARPRGGAGLGLAIVKAITEAHGGTAVVAEGESGAEIRLLLPRVRSAVRQRAPLR